MARRASLFLRLCRYAFAAFALLGFVAAAPAVRAQTFDATNLRQPIDMGMPWLIHAGDDPAYAQPDFDDSHWTLFDPSTSIRAIYPNSQPEIIWYRMHVKVAPNEAGLALSEWNISSAFEIYVNGQKLIQTGQMTPYKPYTFDAELLKPIPDAAIATGSVTIAMRVHISQLDWTNGDPGFFATNLILGQQDALSNQNWLIAIGRNALTWLNQILTLGLGIVALALFLAQRDRREYLWLFLMAATAVLMMPMGYYRLFHNFPAAWEYIRQPVAIANLIFTTLMYFALLRIRFGRWIKILLAVAALGMIASMIGTAHGVGTWLTTALTILPQAAILAGGAPILAFLEFRRGNREAGILLVPALLSGLNIYLEFGDFLLLQVPAFAVHALHFQRLLFNSSLGPFQVNFGDVTDSLFTLSLAIIIVLRSTRMSRQQALLESEFEAARQVQQVILPEQIEAVPGFTVESAYQPAQQVGGDFFQILPAPEGALLLVVGDVAGKGLPAAMLVSVLVGAIRGVAEYTSDPAEMLANLNERLIGRVSGGFATALVARIDAAGTVSLANAGHLPPYIDGREIELPGALPLGIQSRTQYRSIEFHLAAGSRITFYSDGIIEAQNARGELFGFERGRELSVRPVAAIVEAAKQFGQQDDMTVIAIRRDAAVATAA